MSEPATRPLGSYVTLTRGTTYKGALVGQPGPALLGLGSIQTGGGFRDTDFKTYGGECPATLCLYPGDMFAALKGATKDGKMIGSVARVPTSVAVGRLTQDTVKLNFAHRDQKMEQFIYWVLRTPQYREYCAGRAMGSAVVAMSRSDFLTYPIPPLTASREHLVGLFELVEERITLLRETNATLEAIAQALFKSWFVDFDPVRAKRAGRAPEGMIEVTAALFPDSFEDSELGEVPRGWRVGKLEDLLVLQRGFDLPAQDRRPGQHPIIAASGPSGTHMEAMARAPGVVTGRSGVLGRVFLTLNDYWPLNTTLWVKEFKAATPCYAYEVLRMLDFNSFNAGSAVPTLNRNHIHGLPYLVPGRACVEAYESLALQLHQRALLNSQLADTLTTLRDTLLPRLISGQLRLPEAGEATGEALA